MYQLIFAFFVAILLYYILDTFSTKKTQQRKTVNKWITFGVLLVVSYIFIYFMNNAFGGTDGSSLEEQVGALNQNYEVQMIKNITENVRTGFPPF